MKISFYTLGCKLNQAETEDLKQDLKKASAIIVPFTQKADISIIRACGVTCGASQTTREIIRSAKRRGAFVIAMGCLENFDLPEIGFRAKENYEVAEYLLEKITPELKENIYEPIDRTRAFIKIQNGCNFNCSYCIIPHFRGRSTSLPSEMIIKNIRRKVKDGYNEIILTGVNICQYKDDGLDLAELLKNILEKTKIKRVRLGSLDPRLITKKLIELYSDPKNIERLMPHWHLSLQSGSDTVLRKMNRLYTAEKYFKIVHDLRKINPFFSFTTDIIVGFPGESEEDFKHTFEFVKQCEFAKVHVFRFSPRPGTPAEKMKQVVEITKSERAKKLIKNSTTVAKNFANKFIGQIRPVLWENKNVGYTPEFIKIKNLAKKPEQNKIIKLKISQTNLA